MLVPALVLVVGGLIAMGSSPDASLTLGAIDVEDEDEDAVQAVDLRKTKTDTTRAKRIEDEAELVDHSDEEGDRSLAVSPNPSGKLVLPNGLNSSMLPRSEELWTLHAMQHVHQV